MQRAFWKRAMGGAVLAVAASACQSGGGGGFEPLVIDLSQHKATATPAPTPTPAAAAALRPAPAPPTTAAPPRGPSPEPTPAPEPAPSVLEPAEVVDAQLKAFNRHDLEAFLATFAPDATLSDQPEPVRASGLVELRRIYGPGFVDNPSVKVAVTSRLVLGRFVVDSETASGFPDGSSVMEIVIYEVVGGKIAKVWVIR